MIIVHGGDLHMIAATISLVVHFPTLDGIKNLEGTVLSLPRRNTNALIVQLKLRRRTLF